MDLGIHVADANARIGSSDALDHEAFIAMLGPTSRKTHSVRWLTFPVTLNRKQYHGRNQIRTRR